MTMNSQPELEEQKRQIILAIQGLIFPANHEELVHCVRSNHLNQNMLARVEALHERQYFSLHDVLAYLVGDTDSSEGEYENASTPSF